MVLAQTPALEAERAFITDSGFSYQNLGGMFKAAETQ